MGIKNILYITRLVSEKDFTLTGPIEYKYVYGLRKLIGEENVRLTNSININDIEKFEAILLGRDLLDNLVLRRIVIEIIRKLGNKKVFAILDTNEDLLVDKIIHSEKIKVYIKREIPNILIKKEVFERYLLSYLSKKFNMVYLNEYSRLLNMNKLIPCPLSYHIYNENFYESNLLNKKYTISYITNLHPVSGNLFGKYYRYKIHKHRIKLAMICKKIPNSYVKVSYAQWGSGLPLKEYCKILHESYTSLNTTGYDNYRRYEIAYLGSVLISERSLDLIPYDFVEGEHAFFYANIKELKIILRELKGKEDELIKMGKKAREHVIKYHSPEARAKTILNALND